MQPVIAAAASIDAFYQAISGVSFTLLGLWFVIVQLKYKHGAGESSRRRHAYGVAMFFLIPGIGSMLSSVNSDLTLLWRVAFGVTAALGLIEIALYLSSGGLRTAASTALRVAGFAIYAIMLVVALFPTAVEAAGLSLQPRELEAILLALLIFIGANIAFLALTESEETAGA
jgi:hypothetical protein